MRYKVPHILAAGLLVTFGISSAGDAITARAQTTEQTTEQAADKAQTAIQPAPNQPEIDETAPYDDKLLRLAEVLGSVHHLRAICDAGEKNKWRNIMSQLIEAEKPGPQRKARMISRFNRGYNAFRETYANCTPSAIVAEKRYRQEGLQLTAQISNRYGR